MTVQLIATDLDGTFLRDDHQFDHARFQNQLDEINAAGKHFVVASGNRLKHCIEVFAMIDGEMTFVAENGGLVIDKTGQVLSESVIDTTDFQALLQLIRTNPAFTSVHVSVSGRHDAYIRPVDNSKEMQYYLNDPQVISDLATIDDHIYKVSLSWGNQDVRDKLKIINDQFAGRLRATPSGYGGFDVINAKINKAYGLEKLQETWQIGHDQTAAFGDNGNDIEMLSKAKYSYAMINGIAAVKQAANYQTKLDNNHDGVLSTIDGLLANK